MHNPFTCNSSKARSACDLFLKLTNAIGCKMIERERVCERESV